MQKKFTRIVLMCVIVLSCAGAAFSGQEPEPVNLDAMSIEELRAYQGYYYPTGARDPMVMRNPTDDELGLAPGKRKRDVPTLEEMNSELEKWLSRIVACIGEQDYDQALAVTAEAINTIDNIWPAIKPENVDLFRMSEEIRSNGAIAARLKNQQEIGEEFAQLDLKVEGVSWSPMDARAIVNGTQYSAGEVMLGVRKQGDLRVEVIEERGVVFQFQGMRFRLPVSVYAQ